ncbi:hypothetical protein M0812_22696 [Anaeramoeba flamelloides]|uniref:Uncharacterized protein n=1 Tax=Anaeramoeba flamelloides TaxID=1746091 RepID=A0AAV7YY13_9EUKA|nr:hypothetical protein M0812_22696 [Anaeramoeba flamelloides]
MYASSQQTTNNSIISVNIPNTPQVSGRLIIANENKLQNDRFLKQFLRLDRSDLEQEENEKQKLQNRNNTKRVVFSHISLPLLKRNRSRLFNKYYFEELQSTYDQFTNKDIWEIKEIDFQKNKTKEEEEEEEQQKQHLQQQQQQQQQQQSEESFQYRQELDEYNNKNLQLAPQRKNQTEEFLTQKQREANTKSVGYDSTNLSPDSPSFLEEIKFTTINNNTNPNHGNSTNPNNKTRYLNNYEQKRKIKNIINWNPPSILIPWETIELVSDLNSIPKNNKSRQQLHSSNQNLNYRSNYDKPQKNEKSQNKNVLFSDILFDLDLLETFVELIGTGSTGISRESDSFSFLKTQKNLVLDLLQFKEFINEQYDTLFRTSLFPSFVQPHEIYPPTSHEIGSNTPQKTLGQPIENQLQLGLGSKQSEEITLSSKTNQEPSGKQEQQQFQISQPSENKRKRKRKFAPGKRFKLFDLNEDDSDNSDETENENDNNTLTDNDNNENYTTTNNNNKQSNFLNGKNSIIDLDEDNDDNKRIAKDLTYKRTKINSSYPNIEMDRQDLNNSYRNLNRGSINEREGAYMKERYKSTTPPKRYSSMNYNDGNENHHYPQRKHYSQNYEKKSPYKDTEFMKNRSPNFSSSTFSLSTPKDRNRKERDIIYKSHPNRNFNINQSSNLSQKNNYYSNRGNNSYENKNYKNSNYSDSRTNFYNRTYSSSATGKHTRKNDISYLEKNNFHQKNFEGKNEEWNTYKRYDGKQYIKPSYQERTFPNEKNYRSPINSFINSNTTYKDFSNLRNHKDNNSYHPSRNNKSRNYSRYGQYNNYNPHYERSRNYSENYQKDRYPKDENTRRINSVDQWSTDRRRSRK